MSLGDQSSTFPEPQKGPEPIRLWSTSGAMGEDNDNDNGKDIADNSQRNNNGTRQYRSSRQRDYGRRVSMSDAPDSRAGSTSIGNRSRRRQSVHRYVVAGLSKTYPEQLLAPYKIEPAFWQRFVAAVNAALSEFPAWKDPHELATSRRRRRFSFDASMSSSAHDGGLVWWTDDISGASGRDRAEKVLRWWNEDYFKHKGCWITLGFHRDDVPSSMQNDGEESVCDVTSGQSLEDNIRNEQIRRASIPSSDADQNISMLTDQQREPPSLDKRYSGNGNVAEYAGGNSTLKPFLTVHPI
ncbi:hypothetical protein BDF22DRAFT_654163 [Syncephalis plumigaleata]|nr:hypothetical protein BDF22DRAFT_654163 [Syncephalis plumigaleata]